MAGIFGLFDYTKPGPGVNDPPPQSGIKRCTFLFATHYGKLIRLNLLFFVFCLPVITIPAAFSGMTRVLIQLVRKGQCFVWSDFWQEFKSSFARSSAFGLIWLVVSACAYYAVVRYIAGGGRGAFLTGFVLLVWVYTCVAGGYTSVMIALVRLPLVGIIKNATILVFVEWRKTLLLVLVPGGLYVLAAILFPYSVILLLINGFSLIQFIVCLIVNDAIETRVICCAANGI